MMMVVFQLDAVIVVQPGIKPKQTETCHVDDFLQPLNDAYVN
jgi:hypothetical protein